MYYIYICIIPTVGTVSDCKSPMRPITKCRLSAQLRALNKLSRQVLIEKTITVITRLNLVSQYKLYIILSSCSSSLSQNTSSADPNRCYKINGSCGGTAQCLDRQVPTYMYIYILYNAQVQYSVRPLFPNITEVYILYVVPSYEQSIKSAGSCNQRACSSDACFYFILYFMILRIVTKNVGTYSLCTYHSISLFCTYHPLI